MLCMDSCGNIKLRLTACYYNLALKTILVDGSRLKAADFGLYILTTYPKSLLYP